METWLPRIVLSALTLVVITQVISAQTFQEQETKQTVSTASTDIEFSHVRSDHDRPAVAVTINPMVQIKKQLWSIQGTAQISFRSGNPSGYGEIFSRHILHRNTSRVTALSLEGGIGAYRGQAFGQYFSPSIYLGTERQWGRLHIGRTKDTSDYTVIGAELGQHLSSISSNTTVTTNLLYARGYTMYNLAIRKIYQSQYIQILGHFGVCNDPSRATFRPTHVWGLASAQVPLSKHLVVLTSAGQTTFDVERGIPRARFISLGIRIGRHTSSDIKNTQLLSKYPRTFIRNNSGAQTLIIRLEKAKRVEVRGDFTNWQTLVLHPAQKGLWTLPLALKPGVYTITIRIDGGNWQAPPDLKMTNDEFGGTNGVLFIY